MPVNQKSRQQNLTKQLWHSNFHIWQRHTQLAPFHKGILVKNFFALCHIGPDSPEKALCSQVPRSTLCPAFLCRNSVLHPLWMTVLPLRSASLSKEKERTNLPETTAVFPTMLIKTFNFSNVSMRQYNQSIRWQNGGFIWHLGWCNHVSAGVHKKGRSQHCVPDIGCVFQWCAWAMGPCYTVPWKAVSTSCIWHNWSQKQRKAVAVHGKGGK